MYIRCSSCFYWSSSLNINSYYQVLVFIIVWFQYSVFFVWFLYSLSSDSCIPATGGPVTNETAGTKIVELSKKVRELTAEVESEKNKGRQLAKKCQQLQQQVSPFFSSHEHKVLGVSYCDRSLSVVVRKLFYLNIFSSKTAHWIMTKLHRNDPWVVPYQSCSNCSSWLHK